MCCLRLYVVDSSQVVEDKIEDVFCVLCFVLRKVSRSRKVSFNACLMTMEKMPDARSDISVYCLGRLKLMMMSWSVNGFDKRG